MGLGVLRPKAIDWTGVYTLTFQDGQSLIEWHNEDTDDSIRCETTYAVVEDVVRFTYSSDCDNAVEDLKWRLDEDGLHFHLVDIKNAPYLEVKAMYETRPWRKID
jgi:hypothetical protein